MSSNAGERHRIPFALAVFVFLALAILAWLATRVPKPTEVDTPGVVEPPAGRATTLESAPARPPAREPAVAPPAEATPERTPMPELRALARLVARTVDVRGTPAPRATFLALPLDGARFPLSRDTWREGVTDAQGLLDLTDLRPGAWELVLAPTYCPPRRFDLELPPGKTDLGDVSFAVVPSAHDLRVRLSLAREDAQPWGFLHLRSTWGDDVDRWNWIGRGRWTREQVDFPPEFRFEGLPAGRYELAFHREDCWARVARVWVDVPGELVVFDTPAAEPTLRVVSREASGKPVESRFVLLLPDGERAFSETVRSGDHLVGADPGGPFHWVVLAQGFLPIAGSAAEFRAVGGERRLECTLEPGLGAAIVARDLDRVIEVPTCGMEIGMAHDHLLPLCGIGVAIDGDVVARTNESGLAVARLAHRQARVSFVDATRAFIQVKNLREGVLDDPLEPILVRCATRR